MDHRCDKKQGLDHNLTLTSIASCHRMIQKRCYCHVVCVIANNAEEPKQASLGWLNEACTTFYFSATDFAKL